jgi:hypothetical protein
VIRRGRWLPAGRGQPVFPKAMANAAGNNLPGITGALDPPYRPGPGPHSGGQLGGIGTPDDGPDPRAEKIQPYPTSDHWQAWSPGQQGEDGSEGHQSFRRYGTQGFNDKLTVKDRHAYWDTGNQKTGTDEPSSGGKPNSYNNPKAQPPRPDLRLVNRTISYQLGTDTTRNQDDLTRAYTWLGEQGSGWSPVYGGVPGLYSPYGSRGGIPYPIVSPAEQGTPGDGPHLVFAGPPHGLHSTTPWKGGAQIIARFMSIPQTRPVRQDRPANSPQAGQSYSQTVLPQGASRVRPRGGRGGQAGVAGPPGQHGGVGGRGWVGRRYTGGQGSI